MRWVSLPIPSRCLIGPLIALTLLALSAACKDDNAELPDDPGLLEIGSVAENAANALRDGGPELFYQWFSIEFHQRCSEAEFLRALQDARVPASFRDLKKVRFSDGKAEVTLDLADSDGKGYQEEWLLIQGSQGEWYLNDVPDTKDCGR